MFFLFSSGYIILLHNEKITSVNGHLLHKSKPNQVKHCCLKFEEKKKDLPQLYNKCPYTIRNSKNQPTIKTAIKPSITQQLRTYLWRSVWVKTATQLMWLNQLTGTQSFYRAILYNCCHYSSGVLEAYISSSSCIKTLQTMYHIKEQTFPFSMT